MMVEARQPSFEADSSASIRPPELFEHPYVLGTTALMIGYILGSGQWQLLGKSFGRVVNDLANLGMLHLYDSFWRRNAKFFSKPATIH